MFRQIGLVTTRTATRLVYLDAILFLAGGIIGTGHHWYFTGQGTLNMGLASCFSALEVVPLTLLTLDASDFIRLQKRAATEDGADLASRHKWAIYFFIAVGRLELRRRRHLRLPHQHADRLLLRGGHDPHDQPRPRGDVRRVRHARARRARVLPEGHAERRRPGGVTEKYVRVGYWGLNAGLSLMILLDLFPAGVLQLWDVISNGYWHARRLDYSMSGTFHKLEWVRVVGDTVFIVLGALPSPWPPCGPTSGRTGRPRRPEDEPVLVRGGVSPARLSPYGVRLRREPGEPQRRTPKAATLAAVLALA